MAWHASLIINDKLLKIIDESGNTVEQIDEEWIDNIGKWQKTEGYICIMKEERMHVIYTENDPIEFPLEVDLHMGTNIICYPYHYQMNPLIVFNDLLERGNVIEIRNGQGQRIYKDDSGWHYDFLLEPGEAYLVKVSWNDILIYDTEEPTLIEEIIGAGKELIYYDLSGRRIEQPVEKGIYLSFDGVKFEKFGIINN
jgi:hypothetical protein